jgi:uncharacterized peroxidase-related enzyme
VGECQIPFGAVEYDKTLPIGPRRYSVRAETGGGNDRDTCTVERRRWGTRCCTKVEHFNSIDVAPDNLIAAHPRSAVEVDARTIISQTVDRFPHRPPVEPVQAPAFSAHNIFTSSDSIAGLTNDATNQRVQTVNGSAVPPSSTRGLTVEGPDNTVGERAAPLRRSPMSRMAPLPIEECRDPELRHTLEHFVKTLGFVPNSLLTMQRVPAIAKAVVQLNKAVFDPAGRVDLGLKRLVAHMASYAAGCQYCRAHTTVSATRHGIADEKMAAIYEYQTSPLFDDRERAALDFARDAASIPNGVTDASYEQLTRHWSDDEIVEILGVVCMFGVFNRWNDSMATPLEAEPIARAGALLGDAGWNVGKHTSSS